MLNPVTRYVKRLFDPGTKILSNAQKRLPEVKKYFAEYEDKSTEELTRMIAQYQKELKEMSDRVPNSDKSNVKMRKKSEALSKAEIDIYKKLQEIMPEVYAILSQVTKRTYGISHFDVQFVAGLVLATGQKLVEMKTGEGKTMTFHLPLFLYGMTGRGAHLVTVNDYLAKRDGEYAGHVFAALGLSVGVITPQASYKFVKDEDLEAVKGAEAKAERAAEGKISVSKLHGVNLVECSKTDAYGCDVVYGTNNEFGFDYLRDNMVRNLTQRAQRELYFCIVDEADSILIDEARTPLIISAPANDSNSLYQLFAGLVENLKEEEDYVVEHKEKSVNLTDEGIKKMENLLKVDNIWEDYRLAHHMENALKALVFFRRDKEYLVRANEVIIVDEFTGRALAGRRYSEGLHQAIEAKEGVQIQQESKTLASITFQNFFRIYKILTGGSGTIMTEQEEFFKIYNLECCEIPTNLKMIRKDNADRIYKNKEAKFNAVAKEIADVHASGQPILVGTTSISDSELISGKLEKLEIEHEVLNAKYHEREAMIVAKAGEVNAVTVATNMAGRGTDIPLGEGAVDRGGLYVIGTERHEARRIDNQLRGRSGRQGDPGLSRFFVGLDDQIMKMQGGEMITKIMERTNFPDDVPLEYKMLSSAIERSQKRMEGMYFDSRKHVVEYDDVINQQREIFYTRRLRYLELAAEFEKLGVVEKDDEAGQEKLTEIRTKLAKEFSEAVGNNIASLLIDKDNVETLVDRLLSLGEDLLFLNACNQLQLYKSEIGSVQELRDVLKERISALANEPEKLTDFLTRLFTTCIEIKLKEIGNLNNLILAVFVEVMDELWTYHLEYMQDIREGVGLRGVAQLDPLVEYKNEGFTAFKDFVSKINHQALISLFQVKEIRVEQIQQMPKIVTNDADIKNVSTGTREIGTNSTNTNQMTNIEVPKKIGRNDVCFCGSGKKYKKCGLISSPEHLMNLKKQGLRMN